MVIKRLAHVGVAVSNFETTSGIWEQLGLPRASVEEVPSADTRVAFHPVGESAIELLQSMSAQGPVARFLEKRGPGVHHLCFEVDDLSAEMKRLRDLGFRFLSAEAKPGAHGTLVAFMHPKDTDGVLVEFNQPPPAKAKAP